MMCTQKQKKRKSALKPCCTLLEKSDTDIQIYKSNLVIKTGITRKNANNQNLVDWTHLFVSYKTAAYYK